MHLTAYAAYFGFVLLFVLGMYTLKVCARDFRRARGSGTLKPYLYALGIVLSIEFIVLAAIGVLFIVSRLSGPVP
jgi:putative Mn2+ efflux pump MntP